jgi:hypothetical protein
MKQKSKLHILAEQEGKEVIELLEEAVVDSSCKGICTNPECNYTTDVEPDQRKGYCEKCTTNTVCSCLILAGII